MTCTFLTISIMRVYFLLFVVVLFSFSACDSSDDTSEMEDMEEVMDQDNEVVRTAIPDPIFEAYLIGLNADDEIDGFVDTQNLLLVDQIVVDDLGISDLTGIQDCPNLYNLWLQNNSVSTLDVSKNPKLQFIYADGNNLNDINMSGLPLLEKLSLRSNAFTQLDLSANTLLQLLELSGNVISEISLVTNEVLFRLDITENPLTCIEVNEDQLSNQDLEWTLDIDDRLALDCN